MGKWRNLWILDYVRTDRTNLLVFRAILVLERPTVFDMVKANVNSNDPDERIIIFSRQVFSGARMTWGGHLAKRGMSALCCSW